MYMYYPLYYVDLCALVSLYMFLISFSFMQLYGHTSPSFQFFSSEVNNVMAAQGLLKERDLAGTAAFEVALQHIVVRQDRTYHFVQLLIALSFLVLIVEVVLIVVTYAVLPILSIEPEGYVCHILSFASPPCLILPVVCLGLLRTATQRFAIESGSQMVHRLNATVMEPCLGMHFKYLSGKISSDGYCYADRDLLSKPDYTSQT